MVLSLIAGCLGGSALILIDVATGEAPPGMLALALGPIVIAPALVSWVLDEWNLKWRVERRER